MRRLAFVIFEGFQSLDLSGPLEVFHTANRILEYQGRAPAYAWSIHATTPGPIRSAAGLTVLAEAGLRGRRSLDTLFVVGGEGTFGALQDESLLLGLRRQSDRSSRIASICTGAYLVAATGLADGHRLTTHWRWSAQLADAFPGVRVEADCIYLRDGRLYSSGGVSAGIDLALAILEEDLGHALALLVARLLVVYLRRPGTQAQFSAPLEAQTRASDPIEVLIAWMSENPAADLSVKALAARVSMSERNFARVFRRDTGITPHRFVLRLRLEAARRGLEDGAASLDEVADRAGYGSAETLRREFQRGLGLSPRAYQARFATHAAAHEPSP